MRKCINVSLIVWMNNLYVMSIVCLNQVYLLSRFIIEVSNASIRFVQSIMQCFTQANINKVNGTQ